MNDQAQKLRELMFKSKSKEPSFITVTGGDRALGKSLFSKNLAYILKEAGHSPLIMELGEDRGNNFIKSLKNKENPRRLIEEDSSGLMRIEGGNIFALKTKEFQMAKNAFMNLGGLADIIILDASGEPENLARLIASSHHSFLIMTPNKDAMLRGYAIVKRLVEKSLNRDIFLILNQADSREKANIILNSFLKTSSRHISFEIDKKDYILKDNPLREPAFEGGVSSDMDRIGNVFLDSLRHEALDEAISFLEDFFI